MVVQYRQKFKDAYNLIKNAKNILLVSHVNPDKDTISSSCALSLLLDELGKKYHIFCKNKLDESFLVLPNAHKVTKKINNFDNFDLIIVSDCGSLARTGISNLLLNRNANQKVIEFDHHKKVDDYADLEIRHSGLASATELLYFFFDFNNLKISNNIANCLLIGLLSDTSNFAHVTADIKAIDIASKLVKKGANFGKLSRVLNGNKCLNSMYLWGVAIDNLRFNSKYKIAYSVLTIDDIKKFPVNELIYDNITNSLSGIYNAKVSILFKEKKEKRISMSFRSNSDNIDVSKLASYFGGGGHFRASGAMIKGKIKKKFDRYYFIEE